MQITFITIDIQITIIKEYYNDVTSVSTMQFNKREMKQQNLFRKTIVWCYYVKQFIAEMQVSKWLFKNSSSFDCRSAIPAVVSFPPTRRDAMRIFSGCAAAVFAVDKPFLAAVSLHSRTLSSPSRVHSRLLRGTRLSLTSNPKATHWHRTWGKRSALTYYILISYVRFIDRLPSTYAQQLRRYLKAESALRILESSM